MSTVKVEHHTLSGGLWFAAWLFTMGYAQLGFGKAVLAAALHLAETDPQGLMLVAPSDHVIPDGAAFQAAVEIAVDGVEGLARGGAEGVAGAVADGPQTEGELVGRCGLVAYCPAQRCRAGWRVGT